MSSTLLPGWVSSLSPASFDLSLRLTGEDWDKAARIALDDPHFGESGDLSPETSDQITQVLMAGHPKITLTPGHLKIPALDLAFEGEASVDGGAPTAHFNISADSLDKTIALLQEFAKTEPDAQNALLALTFWKGLATTGADGRLVWEDRDQRRRGHRQRHRRCRPASDRRAEQPAAGVPSCALHALRPIASTLPMTKLTAKTKDRSLRRRSRLVHLGRDGEVSQGFINVPAFRGSTVLFPDVATLKNRKQRYTYGTHGTPTTDALSRGLERHRRRRRNGARPLRPRRDRRSR